MFLLFVYENKIIKLEASKQGEKGIQAVLLNESWSEVSRKRGKDRDYNMLFFVHYLVCFVRVECWTFLLRSLIDRLAMDRIFLVSQICIAIIYLFKQHALEKTRVKKN